MVQPLRRWHGRLSAQSTLDVSGHVMNVSRWLGLPTVNPIPTTVGQMLTQGSLVVAFVLVLMATPPSGRHRAKHLPNPLAAHSLGGVVTKTPPSGKLRR